MPEQHTEPLTTSHPDYYTQLLQFTRSIHRSIPENLDPKTSPLISDVASTAGTRGHRVLITGAGSGFGRAAALQWARSGCASAIVLNGRRRDVLDGVRKEVEVAGREAPCRRDAVLEVVVAEGDVSDEADVRRLFEVGTTDVRQCGVGGAIDVVVHAAGVMGPLASVGEVGVDLWWDAVTINLKSCFLVSRELIRSTGAHFTTSTFIHVGTAASYAANPGQSSYTVAKAADNMLLDQLHKEYPTLRVFNVHPGMAKSSVLPPQLELYAKDDPALFGAFTIFLLHPKADFLRGRFVSVNWDVDQLQVKAEEIVRDGLLLNQPFKGGIGPGGHWAGV